MGDKKKLNDSYNPEKKDYSHQPLDKLDKAYSPSKDGATYTPEKNEDIKPPPKKP